MIKYKYHIFKVRNHLYWLRFVKKIMSGLIKVKT